MDEIETVSGQASLALLGKQLCEMGLWAVIERHVKIKQKVRNHTPPEKLLDELINMLAGGHGVGEVNTRVRPDVAVQRAFGRTSCAEQSTISTTFNACEHEQVKQMRAAMAEIVRTHGRCGQHDYARAALVLDIDFTGLVAGRSGEGVTRGYFAHQRNRRGRQLGRVLASAYDEIIVERLYDGKRQLNQSLQELVLAAEDTLQLPENKHSGVILRADGGAGDDASLNWMLSRGYGCITKVKSWQRAAKLAGSVQQWQPDPQVHDREIGWVTTPHAYAQPTRQVAIRHPAKTQGGRTKWHYQVIVFALSDEQLFALGGCPLPTSPSTTPSPQAVMIAAVHAYDLRDGGLETQNRGDKQGLGLSHRNKRKFAAQEMLILLAQLAHNLVIWSRDRLAQVDPHLRAFGVQRTVRDVFQISGHVISAPEGELHVVLNPRHPYAAAASRAFMCDV